METSGIPIEKIKDSQRNTWMAGDFSIVARTISSPAESRDIPTA